MKAGVEMNPLVILGAHNHARRRVKGREEAFRPLLDFILDTSVVVGVPRAPEMSVLATVTDGLKVAVFDGHTFRSLEQEDLLG
jgi:hypothetical protein